MVCAFYKQGQCSKGDKCKFSHDISLDRKGEKRSIYVDARDADGDLQNGEFVLKIFSIKETICFVILVSHIP